MSLNNQAGDLRITASKAEKFDLGYGIAGRMRRAADKIEELERENEQLKAELDQHRQVILHKLDRTREQERIARYRSQHDRGAHGDGDFTPSGDRDPVAWAEIPNHGGC